MSDNFYLNDILTQKAELEKVLAYCRSKEVEAKTELLAEKSIQKVLFSGMGSSHFCAYGANILLHQNGIDSHVVSTGELLHYEMGSLGEGTVLCLISQSGESAEIVRLVERLPKDVFVVAVTNQAQSTLARRGDVTFLLNVSDEISVTTRTYLGSLILAQLIAAGLCGNNTDRLLSEYEKTLLGMESYLENYIGEMQRIKDFCAGMKVISLIGRGNSLSSVRAGALFMREVVKFPAMDFDSAEFRHGPMEMVQDDFYSIVFAPAGRTQKLNTKLASDIAEKGGQVVLITDEEGALEPLPRMLQIILPQVEEYASQLLQILPVQLLANALAEEKQIPVGVFRWGSKIMAKE